MTTVVQKAKLANGIEFSTVHYASSKVVEVRLCFKAGFQYFTTFQHQIPHILEHLLIGNAKDAGGEEVFTARLQSIGALANATTDFEHVTVLLRTPLIVLPEALEIILESVFKADLNEEVFFREKDIVAREIHENFDGIGNRITNSLMHAIFPNNIPETWPEYLTIIDEIQLNSITKAYHRYITTHNLQVIIAGNLSKADTVAVKKLLLAIPASEGAAPKVSRSSKPTSHKIEAIHLDFDENAHISLEYPIYHSTELTPKQRIARNIGMLLLFDAPSAKLNRQLRELGAIYSIDTGLIVRDGCDIAGITIAADIRKVHVVAVEIIRQIALYANGDFSDEEFEAVRKFIIIMLDSTIESVDSALGWYLPDVLKNRTVTTPEDEIKTAQGITKKDVADALKDIFIQTKAQGAITAKDAAFWVPEYDKSFTSLNNETTAAGINEKADQLIQALEKTRSEVPERYGWFWVTYHILGYAAFIVLLFIPTVVENDVIIRALNSEALFSWALTVLLIYILGTLTFYVKGSKAWLAERIGILTIGLSAITYLVGFFTLLGGFSSFTASLPWTLVGVIPFVFATIFAIPAFLSVFFLSLGDKFKR
ncbi:MAG: pitrilysin family protein [Candidatus Microsaccharimonas sp.]